MSENFKETVDLKEKMDNMKRAREQKEVAKRKKIERTRDMDKLFREGENRQEQQKKTQTISKPTESENISSYGQHLAFIILGLIIIGLIYFGFIKKDVPVVDVNTGPVWYAVKLVNDEVYYGQIEHTESDPVIISNVYYNYDQLKNGEENQEEKSSNLRLVKRGKEAHGPSGSMDIVRAQVVYMEPLKEDSKVLRAILDYEK